MIHSNGRAKKRNKIMLYSLWKILACQWELLGYYRLFLIRFLPSNQAQEPINSFRYTLESGVS